MMARWVVVNRQPIYEIYVRLLGLNKRPLTPVYSRYYNLNRFSGDVNQILTNRAVSRNSDSKIQNSGVGIQENRCPVCPLIEPDRFPRPG